MSKIFKDIAKNFFKDDRKIKIVCSDLNDIHFNIATEEYLYEI